MITQQTPIAFSGDIPKYYDSGLGPMFFEPFAIDTANRISKLPVASILEVAAGTGRLTKMLPAVVAAGARIEATDINPAMVNFGKNQTPAVLRWSEADAVSLPFEDNTFDCVVAQFGVMFYSDRAKAYKEALRVLKPGGTFIFTCWDEISNNPMAEITQNTLKYFFPVDTPAFYTVPFSYFDHDKIRNDLFESGFGESTIEVVKLTGFSQSASNAARGLIKGTPTITAIEDRDPEKLPELLSFLEVRIAEKFGKENLRVPLQAIVVSCIKG